MEQSGKFRKAFKMFYGEHEHSIDRKGRLIIPSKFRQAFKENLVERFYVTRGLDGCLFLFAEREGLELDFEFLHELRRVRNDIDYRGLKMPPDSWKRIEMKVNVAIDYLMGV